PGEGGLVVQLLALLEELGVDLAQRVGMEEPSRPQFAHVGQVVLVLGQEVLVGDPAVDELELLAEVVQRLEGGGFQRAVAPYPPAHSSRRYARWSSYCGGRYLWVTLPSTSWNSWPRSCKGSKVVGSSAPWPHTRRPPTSPSLASSGHRSLRSSPLSGTSSVPTSFMASKRSTTRLFRAGAGIGTPMRLPS